MRKLIALVLGLMLLFCTAAAEDDNGEATAEKLYLETETVKKFIDTKALTDQAAPEKACISPDYAEKLAAMKPEERQFILFDVPENARCLAFSVDSCTFLDAENGLLILYQAFRGGEDELESFLKEKDNVILEDKKRAAYTEPETGTGKALLSIQKALDDSAYAGVYLYIEIHLAGYEEIAAEEAEAGGEEGAESVKSLLKAAIEKEAGKSFLAGTEYWADGKGFAGVKLEYAGRTLTAELAGAAAIPFPEDGGQEAENRTALLSAFSGDSFTCFAADGEGKAVKLECGIGSQPWADPEKYTEEVGGEDGARWKLFVAGEQDGKPFDAYAVLQPDETQAICLNVRISAVSGNIYWEMDELKESLKPVLEQMKLEQEPEQNQEP